MSPTHGRLDGTDEHAELDATRRPETRTPDHGPDHGHGAAPALTTGADPRLAGHGVPATGLLALQRFVGNAAVVSLVGGASPVQRAVTIDEIETTVAPAPAPEAGDDASPVTSSGGTTTISGAQINLDSAMTSTPGVIRADTIIANSVVAASYTPGAGNEW